MNKDNVLVGIIGLLLGLIIGFTFANSINQRMSGAPLVASAAAQNQTLPPDHPPVKSSLDHGPAPDMAGVDAVAKLAKDQPNNFEAQRKVADAYYQVQRFDEALEFLKKANQLKPDDYETIVQLGNVNFDATHYEESEKWYMSALQKKADDINVRTDLGLTFLFRDPPNYDRAISEFRQSLQRDPKHEQTLQNLAVAYTRKGDAAQAKDTLAKLEAVSPSNPAIATLHTDIDKMGSATAKN